MKPTKEQILLQFDIDMGGDYEYTVSSTFKISKEFANRATDEEMRHMLDGALEGWRRKINADLDKVRENFGV